MCAADGRYRSPHIVKVVTTYSYPHQSAWIMVSCPLVIILLSLVIKAKRVVIDVFSGVSMLNPLTPRKNNGKVRMDSQILQIAA